MTQPEPSPRRLRRPGVHRVAVGTLIVAAIAGGLFLLLWFRAESQPTGQELRQQLLEGRLLEPQDIGESWVITDPPSRPATTEEATGLCGHPLAGFSPRAEAAAAFLVVSAPVMHALAVYPTAQDAKDAMDALLGAVDACGKWTGMRDMDRNLPLTLRPLLFPARGDQSLAYRIVWSYGGDPVAVVWSTLVWRRGDTLSVVQVGVPFEAYDTLLGELVEKADEKLLGTRPPPAATPGPASTVARASPPRSASLGS
jgi:hypothetical protein